MTLQAELSPLTVTTHPSQGQVISPKDAAPLSAPQARSAGDPVREHVRTGIKAMEPLRFHWLIWHLIAWVMVLAVGGSVFVLSQYPKLAQDRQVILITVATSLLAIAIPCLIASRKRNALARIYSGWRERGVQLLDATASFAAGKGLPRSDFDSSGLNDRFYNTYYSGNLLSVGDIRTSSLSAKHIYTEKYWVTEYYTDSSGRSQSRQVEKERTVVVPIFDGLLLVVPVTMPHQAWVVLRQKGVPAPKGSKALSVASPYLAKSYLVASTDQFAGHRLLTPSLMQELGDHAGQFKVRPAYSYRQDTLFITMPGYYLKFGNMPGKWLAVTETRLQRTLDACHASIKFLKTTAQKLKPS